jgi:uncharacterized protein YegL
MSIIMGNKRVRIEEEDSKKTYIQEVCALIDRSGSMAGKELDTIGGINETFRVLRETREPHEEIKISIKLFDHDQILLVRNKDLNEVSDLTRDNFQPRGQTALLDAMGDTLTYFMEKKLKDPGAYDSCVIYVTTDGVENASRRYNNKKIKKMVHLAEDTYNIRVIYLGANQDAILEAGKFGIDCTRAMNYNETSENSQSAYRSAASAVARTRSSGRTEFSQAERQASVI